VPEHRIKVYSAKIKELGLQGEELRKYMINNFQKLGFPKRGTAIWFFYNYL